MALIKTGEDLYGMMKEAMKLLDVPWGQKDILQVYIEGEYIFFAIGSAGIFYSIQQGRFVDESDDITE